ncbi:MULTISPECIES: crotonase/enoyl-CoA hydratase family protein [unclassified Frankia]|uniref:crotonase/enoyl-CoA hydratase family protein n=1 Tax=unclassified Frankia TaxID=2632575 RepID=UPI0020253BD8
MPEVSDPGKVLVSSHDHVVVITLNRPDARNAVDHDVCLLVGNAVAAADSDPDVRVIILTGAGDQAFSAGADLKAIMRGERILPVGREHWSIAGFANHFTSKPTIAAVNGAALGGGTELALSCDLVVAVETATIGLPEVKRGLVAGAGGAFRLIRQLPHRVALELLLTGEPMSATDALRWGLINRVVPAGGALDAAMGLAAQIAANAPLAVQASKRIAYGADDGARHDEDSLWALTEREFAVLALSEDAKEGPRAFAEKRSPIWLAR